MEKSSLLAAAIRAAGESARCWGRPGAEEAATREEPLEKLGGSGWGRGWGEEGEEEGDLMTEGELWEGLCWKDAMRVDTEGGLWAAIFGVNLKTGEE